MAEFQDRTAAQLGAAEPATAKAHARAESGGMDSGRARAGVTANASRASRRIGRAGRAGSQPSADTGRDRQAPRRQEAGTQSPVSKHPPEDGAVSEARYPVGRS